MKIIKEKEKELMYEELIKRLGTISPEEYGNPLDFAYAAQQAMCEAAAAIHQLRHHAADWERIADHWRKRCEELEHQIRQKEGGSDR